MKRILLICILAITIFAYEPIHGNEEQEDDSKENFAVALDEKTFDNAIAANNHLVMFYAPWCGHCKRLHPLWEQLAELMNVKGEPKVIIAKVDCTQEQELCSKYDVTGYPTLRFFKLGVSESVKFKGTRDMPSITEFINQQLHQADDEDSAELPTGEYIDSPEVVEPSKGKPLELTEDSFAKHVSSGNHFVKFYAPWCSHCQRLAPTWEDLARDLADHPAVSIAKVDCTVYRPICQDFEVKGYPTLLWIVDGKKIEKYSGGRNLEALKEYVIKMLGTPNNDEEEVPEKVKEEAEKEQGKVIQLTADKFQDTINEGITFVKFYAPWCGHCQKLNPTWDQLAEKLQQEAKHSIKIAKVDCTAPNNKNLCVEQQVEGYPTLYAYKNGERQTEYDGGRSLLELNHYISKFVAHDEL